MTIDDGTFMITAPTLLLGTFVLLIAMLKGHIRRRDGMLLVLIYVCALIVEFVFRRNGLI